MFERHPKIEQLFLIAATIGTFVFLLGLGLLVSTPFISAMKCVII